MKQIVSIFILIVLNGCKPPAKEVVDTNAEQITLDHSLNDSGLIKASFEAFQYGRSLKWQIKKNKLNPIATFDMDSETIRIAKLDTTNIPLELLNLLDTSWLKPVFERASFYEGMDLLDSGRIVYSQDCYTIISVSDTARKLCNSNVQGVGLNTYQYFDFCAELDAYAFYNSFWEGFSISFVRKADNECFEFKSIPIINGAKSLAATVDVSFDFSHPSLNIYALSANKPRLIGHVDLGECFKEEQWRPSIPVWLSDSSFVFARVGSVHDYIYVSF